MNFYYVKMKNGDSCVYQETEKAPFDDDTNIEQLAIWDSSSPYVEMIKGTGPVSISGAGWPQVTKEEFSNKEM